MQNLKIISIYYYYCETFCTGTMHLSDELKLN
nr:MAG TPA: hypothetical protein [Caudoviricetes sp.]DAQ99325.1 MAG TPA: hypothetical protein [Caudoviricetes sp.]